MNLQRHERGFTLLEVVVAVAVLTIGVTVALQVFGQGLNNVRRIDMAHRAISHAENVMNELLADETLVGPLHDGGDLDEDFSYQATVDYWDDPERQSLDPELFSGIYLLAITVDVHYKDNRQGRFYRAFCLKTVSENALEEDTGLSGVGGARR